MHKQLTTYTAIAAAVTLAGCASLQPELPEADAQIGNQWNLSTTDTDTAPLNTESYGTTDITQIDWNDFFSDPKLKQLIQIALENNRDLRVAALNVERARAQYRIQRSDRIPNVNASGSMTRLGGDGQTNVEQYQADLGITQFELDLFGRVYNLSEAALKSYLATEQAQRSVQLSLIAEVANAYLTLSADLELQRIANATYENYQEFYGITERREELGAVSTLDLSQARTLLTSAKAEIYLYDGLVASDKTALALLVGTQVDSSLFPDTFNLQVSGLSPLPADLPSEALLRRPDIQQAEFSLLAANANLGAARAAFFPSIRLTGTIGTLSGDISDLFSSGTDTWSFIPQITIPIFQGGQLRANRDMAAADRDIALANYEKAIQSSFKETSDALTQSWTYAQRREALEAFVESAMETESISQSRYDAGRDSYLALLEAQRVLYNARKSLVQSQLQEQSNRVNLYKVLGGGWKPES